MPAPDHPLRNKSEITGFLQQKTELPPPNDGDAQVLGELDAHLRIAKLMFILRQETLSRKIEPYALLSIFILALGLRVGYLFIAGVAHRPPQFDGIEYDLLATNQANGQGFTLTVGQPHAFRPPGFPSYIALLYRVFGRSYFAIRFSNAFLGALTCLLIYAFTKNVWRWQTALFASLGAAFHPLLIYFTGLIYPESLILFLLALVFLLATNAMRSRRIREMPLIALVFGFLTYLRPSLLALGLAQTVWVQVSLDRIKERILASSVLVLGIILILIPWNIRNFQVFDDFIWISTNGGVTFWASNNPMAEGGWTEPSPATWQGANPPSDLRGWPGLTEKESEARFRDAALAWIRNNPGDFLRLLPKKLIRGWSINFGNEARQMSLPAIVPIGYSIFLSMSLLGFILSLRQWRKSLVLYLSIAVSSLTTLVFYGSTRQSFLLPLPLLIFCSLFLNEILRMALGQSVFPAKQPSSIS